MHGFQITVQVEDDGDPVNFSTGTITVLVPRDLQNPTLNLPSTITIEESVLTNSTVFTVIGSDLDLRVSTFYFNTASFYFV